MSLQWTFVATFLYMEVIAIALLLLPFIRPRTWQKLFHSKAIRALNSYGYIYFNVFMLVLFILFLDAVRDVHKYSHAADDVDLSIPNAEALMNMKLFRSQRNLYIAGFALFLWLVLSRLCTLISNTATLLASNEASIKQAENASETAKKFMDDLDKAKKAGAGDTPADDSAVTEELSFTKEELKKAKEDLEKTQNDLNSLKKQAEGVSNEYDRLLKEHSALQKQVESEDSKKDS